MLDQGLQHVHSEKLFVCGGGTDGEEGVRGMQIPVVHAFARKGYGSDLG